MFLESFFVVHCTFFRETVILWFLRTAIVITVRIKTMAAKFRDGDTVYYQGDSSAYVFAHSDDQRILPSYIGVLTLTLIACIFFMWVPITRYVIVGVAITSIITTFSRTQVARKQSGLWSPSASHLSSCSSFRHLWLILSTPL